MRTLEMSISTQEHPIALNCQSCNGILQDTTQDGKKYCTRAISPNFICKYQGEYDVDIPVKRGLKFEVPRQYHSCIYKKD